MKPMVLACFIVLLSVPSVADDISLHEQMLDKDIETLTQERDAKYSALKDCESRTKGFKIAGITTLVATGIGIDGNIKLAQKFNASSGNKSATVKDNRPQEEKDSDSCEVICGAGQGCSCIE